MATLPSAVPDTPNPSWSTVAHIARPVSSQLEYSSTAQTPIDYQGNISLLPTALVEVRNAQGQFITCRVLLDCASELSYISERSAHRLGLSRSPSRIVVTGISSVKAETTRGCINIHIKSRFSDYSLNACVHVLHNITSSLPRSTLNKSSAEYLCEKDLADPSFYISSPIDILLGINHVWNIFTLKKIFDKIGNLVAISSMFGWVITSAASTEDQTTSSFVSTVDIDRSLRSFWEMEEANYPLPTDPINDFVEQHFLKTYTRHVDGKYMVFLPFKQHNVTFSNTLQGALSRFTAVERRLIRDNALQKQYVDFMREYIKLGHMRELHNEEISISDGRLFYMPHHPILGTKLRVVFDGSFQDTTGVSLNSTLHIGPSIQRNLFAVCLRFRLDRFVFSADIVKMFRQIWVAEKHRNYQRIVWRENPSDPIKHYQLCTVTYGTSCAPFLSIRVLEQLAQDYKNEYPIASRILMEDFYVDDVLTGAPTEIELVKKRDDLVKLLRCAGLELRKWVSNTDSITSNLSDLPATIFCKSSENDTTKVLGIYWKPKADVLAFKVCLDPSPLSSKRQVLSDVSRIFDPLGLLAPVVVQFKILFQQLWLHNLSWDDQLPLSLANWWIKCRNDINNIVKLSLPRFICNSVDTIELHGFSDASIKAYAAVVYCRCRDEKGEFQVNLVTAKTRVAPLKQLSLPRLELCGAVLLTRLMSCIKENLRHKSVIINAWCDSTVVLSWLSQPPFKLKTFVANRTAEILDTLPRNIWSYVASKENPADCASRGLLAQDLLNFDLWWRGPPWLHNDELYQSTISKSNIFNLIPDSEYTTEFKTTINMFTSEETSKDAITLMIDKISSWRRLLRVMTYVLRFVKRIHPRNRRQLSGGLTCEEIHEAQVLLIRSAQNNFEDERSNLRSKTELSRKSKLLKLSPFLDNDGLIRVGGRIGNSQLEAAVQHPIVLPKEHRITRLILLDEHERHLHPGVSALFVIIRQKYWVFGARNLIRQLTHKCIKCFRQRQLSTQQQMANLPAIRVRQAFPFENSGVDYAGPITLKMYRGRNARTSKGYICLFVCLVTSAIHLELATDLTTDCFLAALRRFMSRRGKCSQILSDNGRNFIGASRALGEMHKIVISQQRNEIVTASLAEDGIRWNFNPPHAPHWGGIWESAVRSVKLHLRRVIGNTVFTFEQMNTLLAQIEAVINSRPLGVAVDSEINYLSPSHFLIGRPYTMIPEGDFSDVEINRLDYWQHVQNMYQGFWRKWHQEYLTSLQQRPKWKTPQASVVVGNIVVVKENNIAPAKWLMAKIIETYPGDDGLVRAVRLRTTYGEMTRPITKIVVLPIL